MHIPTKINLMSDIDQVPAFDLCVTRRQPGSELVGIQLWATSQSLVDGVQDEMQEIRLVSRVAR